MLLDHKPYYYHPERAETELSGNHRHAGTIRRRWHDLLNHGENLFLGKYRAKSMESIFVFGQYRAKKSGE